LARLIVSGFNANLLHIHHSAHLSFKGLLIVTHFFYLLKKRVIFHNHANDFVEFWDSLSLFWKKIIIKSYERADAVIIINPKLFSWYKTLSEKVNWIYIPNAVKKVADYPIKPEKQIYILYLARVEQKKGIFDLLKAILKLSSKQNLQNVQLLICGDGDLESVRKFLQDHQLNECVKLMGVVKGEKKVQLLYKSHIFVLPSYYEVMPISILEAGSYGVVPIASDVGNVAEVIEHGVNGYLIKPGDINALESLLESLINNCTLREQFSKRIWQKINRDYSEEKFIDSLDTLYQTILKKC
jgi:glycosyltransferase involved in cell wall biosynthesis